MWIEIDDDDGEGHNNKGIEEGSTLNFKLSSERCPGDDSKD